MKYTYISRFACGTLVIIMILLSCGEPTEVKQPVRKPVNSLKKNQQVIVIRPIGRIDMKKVAVIKSRLDKIFDSVVIRKPEQIPTRFYYKPRSRYRADSIVGWLAKGAREGEVHLAVTGFPISITQKELKIQDYGVFGWGNIIGPQTCVVSDFLLKRKDLLYIIAEHELGHNFGLDHCPTAGCYMMAGNGKDRTASMTGFCGRCKGVLMKEGWRL
jgi:archaemetzincin